MEDLLSKYAIQFGGFGILLLYLYLEGKRKDAKIAKLEEAILLREQWHNTRIDAYIDRSLAILEVLKKRETP